MSNSGMTTIEVKRINRSKVYQMIYEKRSISKQELAQELHMGLTTVTQNLKALEEDGWIHRTGYYESTGGRKAQAIEIVSNGRTSETIDFIGRFESIRRCHCKKNGSRTIFRYRGLLSIFRKRNHAVCQSCRI